MKNSSSKPAIDALCGLEYTLDLFAQAPQSCRVGDRFTVGTTQLEFRVERIDGNRCIVRGESGRKRILPREYVDVRCTTARMDRTA